MHSIVFPEGDLKEIQRLYDEGKYVSAWKSAEELGPITDWKGAVPCTLAARIAGNLEANRFSYLAHVRAWRADRSDPMAAYFRGCIIGQRLGPLRALRFLEKLPDFKRADAQMRAGLLSLRMRYLADYRDLNRVEALWMEAHAIAPDDAWIWVERAAALLEFDAYAEGLAASQQALALRPWYRPAVQSVAHMLTLNGRDEEAITLLRSATERLESPAVAAQLAALLVEHDRHEEALTEWKRYRELAIAIEPNQVAWWHSRMSDACYELGRISEAGEHARLAKNGFHEQIAERLLNPPAEAKVVRLTVPFVRQHSMTCAPATLSALCGYWKVPVDHLELAREICYDGTQSFRERQWAEQKQLVAREFTITWDVAVALLDRGIPFTMATVETRSAHLQAIMGYDGIRGTLIVRDPYLKHPGEFIGEKWLESYASSGPRGMLLLPAAEISRLDGVELPDAALYDHLYALSAALFEHDRDRALKALAALEVAAPQHRITWEAKRELAWYDGNQAKSLVATEGLLAQYPDSNRLRWNRYWALDGLSRHADRRAQLAELARGKDSEPVFWREFGADLRRDARELPAARRWLLRALRFQPKDAEILHTMAGILWDERRRTEALALYRLAANARDKVEYLQHSWFNAARHLRKEAEVLEVMRERARREAKRSSSPSRTLSWALSGLGREHEALAELELAVEARPNDGSLLCHAADAFARHGNADRAQALLKQAEGLCPRTEWLRAAAEIADYRPDPPEALHIFLQAAPEEPLDVNLHETIARLYAETQGNAAAVDYLRKQIEKFPHHLGFREAFIRRNRSLGAERCEEPLRELIRLAPGNAWAIRELALVLVDLNRAQEALEWCDKAIALAPKDESSQGIRAFVLLRLGDFAGAVEGARVALTHSVDYTSAFDTLLNASQTYAEKQSALAFILEELKRQTVFGSGLLEYRTHAFRVLEPDELLRNLEGAREARPDLWHAWSAVIMQLCDMKKAPEALSIALEAAERFPLSVRSWSDLARVHSEMRNFQAEEEALRRAVALRPTWGWASRQLSLALQRVDRYEEAERVLEDAIAAAPLDAFNHLELGRILWRRSRSPRASELFAQAVRLDPSLTEAWSALGETQPSESTFAVDLARSVTESRAGETGPWMRLAEVLPAKALEERLAAVNRALKLDPREEDASDLKAWLLTEAGRYEEALESCDPPIFAGNPPRGLRARAAWVIAQRGNLQEAIDKARAILKTEPDYYWAWERVAEWCERLGQHDGEREAAEKMARLNPRSAIPLGYLAEAMIKQGKGDEALEVLKRAFELDPSYGFAGFNIFNQQIRSGDFTAAEATIGQLQRHLPGPDTIAATVRLATARRDRRKAAEAFRQVLSAPERESRAIFQAAKAMKDAGWDRDVEDEIWKNRETPGMNAECGGIWVRSFMQRKKWSRARKAIALDAQRGFGATALRELANQAGEMERLGILRKLVRSRREWLFEDTEGWGLVGFAWIRCGRWKDALPWLASWRNREGLKPWILSNVAYALECAGRDDEAMEVNRAALSLPRDHSSAGHITSLSAREALLGDVATAMRRLEDVQYDSLNPSNRAEYAMVKALDGLMKVPEQSRRSAMREKRSAFYAAHSIVHSEPTLKPLRVRFDQALANIAGLRSRPLFWRGSFGDGREIRLLGVVFLVLFLISATYCSNAGAKARARDHRGKPTGTSSKASEVKKIP